jgi:hypothetical protein
VTPRKLTGILVSTAAVASTFGSARGDDPAPAATATATPGLHLESGVVLADGGTIRVTGAALIGADGKLAQRLDVTLKLSGEAGGTLRLDQMQATPTLLSLRPADQFLAGPYVGGDGTQYTVRGGAVSPGGRTSWGMTFTAVGKPGAKPITFDASFTTGPAVGNPELANQEDLKTLPDGYAYGNVTFSGVDLGFRFYANAVMDGTAVIGARQVGDSLQIAVFKHDAKIWTQQKAIVFLPPH